MSKKKRRSGARWTQYGRSAFSMVWLYLLSLAGAAAAVFLIFLFGLNIYHALVNIYYYSDNIVLARVTLPLYYFMAGVRDSALLVVIVLCAGGWFFVTYWFFRYPQKQVHTVVEAASHLLDDDASHLQLPPELNVAEAQLRLVRQQAQRSAQIAREAEQRKNDLIVYLAHDLKTPLTSVIGYLTLLRDEPQISTELRARYTNIALDKAERLEDLINEFFDITRFNLSHIELELRKTDLTRMVEQVVSEFGPMLAEKQLTCRTELPARMEYACDPDKMARVFDNLLRNACHYSYPDTEVTIRARTTESEVMLSFENQGHTIPPEKLDRLFEQFFRLDESRASRTGGAGLGLAIAKEIIELHGGTIAAESADEHIRFVVRLPLRDVSAAGVPGKKAAARKS
nr:HAMP domain-containing sensor histidine kinase [uncultured Gemmiger sp.]